MSMLPTIWLIIARAIHFAACLLLVSIWYFHWLVIDQSELRNAWRPIARRLLFLALPIALISGALWFIFLAANLSGFDWMSMRLVWNKTKFGALWQIRLGFWMAAAAAYAWRGRFSAALLNASILLLLASLAWAGHGRYGHLPTLHLASDVLHLLVTGVWPAGLAPLAWLLLSLRHSRRPETWNAIAIAISRFSRISLIAVGLLIVTGVINSCFMLHSVTDLVSDSYGRTLLLKIGLVAVLILIGAINRQYLLPRISTSEPAMTTLRRNVILELIFSTAVIIVVAILGTLSPPRV
jgi:copper resistance protein D